MTPEKLQQWSLRIFWRPGGGSDEVIIPPVRAETQLPPVEDVISEQKCFFLPSIHQPDHWRWWESVFFFLTIWEKKQLQLVWFVNLTKPENMGLFLFTFKHQRLHFLFCSFFSWLSPKPVFFGLFSSTICLILKVDFSHFNISLTNINYSFYVLVSRWTFFQLIFLAQ